MLLHPFSGNLGSLQSDWLSEVRFIRKSHCLLLNCTISLANENGTLKQNNQSDFKACLR